MDSRKKYIILGFVFVSFLSTVVTLIVYRDAPPVSALEIPQSTKDFFKRIGDLGHLKFDFEDSLDVEDYNNNNDYDVGLKKLEDDNFIIYYSNVSTEFSRAKKTLKYANEAIPKLAEFFGKYYYPKYAKNRKLSIYLGHTKRSFDELCEKLAGSSVGWAAGITVNTFSSNGDKLCNGIILNSMVQDGESTDLKKVIFHEMAHYNHFQCMDLLSKSEYLNWEVEGLASFFAKDWNKEIPDDAKINQYSLQRDPENYGDAYWMGYHAFGLVDKTGRLQKTLQNSFSKSLLVTIPEVSGCTMSDFDSNWRIYCNKIQSAQ
jgi:hypothetical protein